MVWQELTPGQHWSGFNPGIYYSRWNGDAWSGPLKISQNTGFAEIPSIAADATDTVHAIWDDETYGGDGLARVAYKTRDSAGTWSEVETLPTPSGTIVNWNSRIAIGTANVPNVAFTGNTDGYKDSIYWSSKVSGSWTTPVLVSLNASDAVIMNTQWSDLRSDSSGNLYLIYWSFTQGIFYRKYNGTSWSTPFSITSAPDIEFTRMTVTPAGEVFVTWYQRADDSVRVRWTQGGTWQNETTLTTQADISFWGFPIMGITSDSKERAHVGWGERDSTDGLIDLKYSSFVGGTWAAARDVDLNNNDADTPFVFPDKWDNQHFAWTEYNQPLGIWEIYYRVAEGTIQTISTTGGTITANPNNITYLTLNIPNGALPAITEIGVQIGPVPENVDQNQVTIPRAFTFRPHGLVFNNASSLTVFYDDAELAGADERQLKPWVWNSQTSAWEAKTGNVNRAQNKITVDLNGFSLYGISAPLFENPTWIAPSAHDTVKQASMLFEFQLPFTYKDGSEIVPPESPDDELKLIVKDSSGNTVQTLKQKPGEINKDEGKNRYKGTLNFQKDGYENGEYTLEVYLIDTLVGRQSFTLNR